VNFSRSQKSLDTVHYPYKAFNSVPETAKRSQKLPCASLGRRPPEINSDSIIAFPRHYYREQLLSHHHHHRHCHSLPIPTIELNICVYPPNQSRPVGPALGFAAQHVGVNDGGGIRDAIHAIKYLLHDGTWDTLGSETFQKFSLTGYWNYRARS